MGILWNIVRVTIAAVTIVAVAEVSKKFPRYRALLLSLPIVTILAFVMSWYQHHPLPAISKLANETVVLVLLGLPFFVPPIFYNRSKFLGIDGGRSRTGNSYHRHLARAWSQRLT